MRDFKKCLLVAAHGIKPRIKEQMLMFTVQLGAEVVSSRNVETSL